MAAQLSVDRIRCDGYGMCAELLPEFIDLDDWGYPILRPGPVPRRLEALAQRAVDVCPVLALRLRPALHESVATRQTARRAPARRARMGG